MKSSPRAVLALTALLLGAAAPESHADCTWTAVSAGAYRSCGLRSDGAIECWGLHVYYGADPTPVGMFVAVSSGFDNYCGIRQSGELECWGDDFYFPGIVPAGSYTQVSVGADSFVCALRSDGKAVCFGDEDYPIHSPADSFTQIASGWSHACGIRTDGSIDCWGDDANGKSDAPDGTFVRVAAGRSHSCAVRSDGTLACWGADEFGQSSPPGGQYLQVAAGDSHSCAVSTAGTLSCWGDDSAGQTDVPSGNFVSVSTFRHFSCALRSDDGIECWGTATGDTEAVPGTEFASVSAGYSYNCGLRTDGLAECWGTNSPGSVPRIPFVRIDAGGAVGCGITSEQRVVCWDRSYSSLAEAAPTTGSYSRVSIGGDGICALKIDGALHCWAGDNVYVPSADLFSEIALGQGHGCGIRQDGTLACWGGSDGTTGIPSGVFTQIAAGDNHSCAIRNDGTVHCWGYNGGGQTDAPGGTFLQVACGEFFSCGLRPDHTVDCWGHLTDPPDKYVQISGQASHVCGMLESGAVRCFGGDYPFDETYDPRALQCGTCGNGVPEQAEECDDGNLVANDGCSDTCVPDCSAQPMEDCKFAQRSKLRIRDGSDGREPEIRWDWMKGSHTDEYDLEDPRYRAYHLCLYPDSQELGAETLLPRHGWGPYTMNYEDPAGFFDGIVSLSMTPGEQGRAGIRLRSEGEKVPDGLLPATSFIVQIQSADDHSEVCWESVFPAGKSKPGSFQARARY